MIRERRGSRNAYQIRAEPPMRHQLVRGHNVGTLLALLEPRATEESGGKEQAQAS